jgi:uncharacterized protein with HEPN domain
MKRSATIALHDLLDAIDAAAEMIGGADLGRFRSDRQLRYAVERCIEIVSEASRRVPDEAKARFPEVPWPEIAAIGNRLRHEYGRLDTILVWKVATRSLPDLRPVVIALIETDGRT